MENLARYIIRASFSQKRMKYIPEEAKVTYRSKYSKGEKEFSELEWMAILCSHIPDRGEQTVRYYSNVCRGRRKRQNCDGADFIITDDEYRRGCNKSWARLIRKIYEVDPLICPKCGGDMRIIAPVEDYKVIKKILDYLKIYEFRRKRPPPVKAGQLDDFDDYSRDDYIDYDYVDL